MPSSASRRSIAPSMAMARVGRGLRTVVRHETDGGYGVPPPGEHLRQLGALALLLGRFHLVDAFLLEPRDVGLYRLHRRIAELDRSELDLIRRRHLRAVAEQPGHQQTTFISTPLAYSLPLMTK